MRQSLPKKYLLSRLGQVLDGRIELTQLIGIGAYGAVYAAYDHVCKLSRAVKALPRRGLDSRQKLFQQRELYLHSICHSHPNILSLIEILESEETVYMILEYCPNGDLFTNITEGRKYIGCDNIIKIAFLQLIDALQYCHSRGIYHRDLKPENIMVANDGFSLLLADFGLSTNESFSFDFGCGSVFYMSPECVFNPPNISNDLKNSQSLQSPINLSNNDNITINNNNLNNQNDFHDFHEKSKTKSSNLKRPAYSPSIPQNNFSPNDNLQHKSNFHQIISDNKNCRRRIACHKPTSSLPQFDHGYSTAANDVWSLGVILVNMTCGRNPWRRASIEDATFKRFKQNPYILGDILPVTKECLDILISIFDLNPLTRITLSELRNRVLKVESFCTNPVSQEKTINPSTIDQIHHPQPLNNNKITSNITSNNFILQIPATPPIHHPRTPIVVNDNNIIKNNNNNHNIVSNARIISPPTSITSGSPSPVFNSTFMKSPNTPHKNIYHNFYPATPSTPGSSPRNMHNIQNMHNNHNMHNIQNMHNMHNNQNIQNNQNNQNMHTNITPATGKINIHSPTNRSSNDIRSSSPSPYSNTLKPPPQPQFHFKNTTHSISSALQYQNQHQTQFKLGKLNIQLGRNGNWVPPTPPTPICKSPPTFDNSSPMSPLLSPLRKNNKHIIQQQQPRQHNAGVNTGTDEEHNYSPSSSFYNGKKLNAFNNDATVGLRSLMLSSQNNKRLNGTEMNSKSKSNSNINHSNKKNILLSPRANPPCIYKITKSSPINQQKKSQMVSTTYSQKNNQQDKQLLSVDSCTMNLRARNNGNGKDINNRNIITNRNNNKQQEKLAFDCFSCSSDSRSSSTESESGFSATICSDSSSTSVASSTKCGLSVGSTIQSGNGLNTNINTTTNRILNSNSNSNSNVFPLSSGSFSETIGKSLLQAPITFGEPLDH